MIAVALCVIAACQLGSFAVSLAGAWARVQMMRDAKRAADAQRERVRQAVT